MLKSDEARERPGQWRRVVERRTPGDLDGQIGELLGGLTEDLNVWKALAERFQGNIFCGLFMSEENEGIEISSQTLLLIGSRGLKFDFDVYAPGE